MEATAEAKPERARVNPAEAPANGKPEPPVECNEGDEPVGAKCLEPKYRANLDVITPPREPLTFSASIGEFVPKKEPFKASAQFRSRPGIAFTVFGTMDYDFNLARHKDVSYVGRGQFPDFAWRPVTPSGATQKIYELDKYPHELRSLSFSVLATLLFPEVRCGRFGIATGPSIFYGTGTNGSFKQLTFDVVWSPPWSAIVDKLYLVAGVGPRWANVPLVDHVGDRLAFAVTNNAVPTLPKIEYRTQAMPVFMLSLGFDLSVLKQLGAVFGVKSGDSK